MLARIPQFYLFSFFLLNLKNCKKELVVKFYSFIRGIIYSFNEIASRAFVVRYFARLSVLLFQLYAAPYRCVFLSFTPPCTAHVSSEKGQAAVRRQVSHTSLLHPSLFADAHRTPQINHVAQQIRWPHIVELYFTNYWRIHPQFRPEYADLTHRQWNNLNHATLCFSCAVEASHPSSAMELRPLLDGLYKQPGGLHLD